MRRKTLLFFLFVIILTFTASGCFPKVPKKVVGPTWETSYTIPIIKAKQINLASDDEDGLDLEGVSLNYYSNHKTDKPATFELFQNRVTIEPGTIAAIEFPEYPFPTKTIDLDGYKTEFHIDLDGYKRVTLSNDAEFYNYTNVFLENAQAASEGVTLSLLVGDTEKATTTIPPGNDHAKLAFSGLTLEPDKLEIKVSGSMGVVPGLAPRITFEPVAMEITSITLDTTDLDRIKEQVHTEPFDLSLEFPSDAEIFELQLKEARIAFTPENIPDGLSFEGSLLIEALDQAGNVVSKKTWYENEDVFLENGKEVEFDGFKETLNEIFTFKEAHTVNILLKITPKVEGREVTLTYPGEITLNQNIAIALDYLTYASSIEGPDGSMEVPEELPLEVKSADVFFEIQNTSPVALTLEVWLSPNPINLEKPATDPNAFKNVLTIAGNKTESSVLRLNSDEFSRLAESKTIYHLIKFNNDSGVEDPIEEGHYLKITSWAQVTCTVNKRGDRR